MIDQFYDNIDEDLFNDTDADLLDNMPIQLECNVPECDKGPDGVTWKTPALSEENALKLLERHETIAHVQQGGAGAGGGGGAGGAGGYQNRTSRSRLLFRVPNKN